MAFSVVVLAAGKGIVEIVVAQGVTKVGGVPMVQRIINTVKSLGADNIHLVYGHGGDQLKATVVEDNLNWCLQAEQLGTGHAVQQAASPY